MHSRTTHTIALLVIIGAFVMGAFVYERFVNAGTWKVGREIQVALARRDLPDDAPWRDRRTRALLNAFYQTRRMRPAWTSGAGPSDQAHDLSTVLLAAGSEGLDPDHYSAAEVASHLKENRNAPFLGGDAKALADFDLLCSIAAFHYMSDVFDGRISPRALDAIWVTQARKGDLHAMLGEALRRGRVKQMLESLPPTAAGYQRLREARARYAEIVADGGWRPIPPGRPMKKGDRGPRIAALRARLAASGDLASARSDVYDGAVDAAVRRVQARYGRDADGVVGATELAELNVSAGRRLQQIELNMERWRWLPKSFGERYLVVNIPEYALHVYEGGKDVLDMRVVVGKEMNQTPVFSDQMTQVVINPTWGVPASIVKNELLPIVQSDPDYLARNRIRVFAGEGDDAEEIDARSLQWGFGYDPDRLSFRQDPGEENALGRIKFLLPNRFDIYLHDTPAGHLFSAEERSFSHGCVRVEDPIKLASYVLRGTPEANPRRIEELIARGKTTTLEIPRPLPVHIVYFTALVGDDRTVGFREDVYGIDADLMRELRGRERAQERQQAAAMR